MEGGFEDYEEEDCKGERCLRSFRAGAFKVVLWEGDALYEFAGGVIGFSEEEDVRVVGSDEAVDVEDGGVEATGVRVDEVEVWGL
jgi:hypothetical protein